MSRQINLYSEEFRRQRKPFSAEWTAAAFLIVVVGAYGYHAWVSHQLLDLRARRSEAAAQLKQLRDQLVSVGQASQKTRNKTLEDQVARDEALFNRRRELLSQLKSREIGNREGYSKFLTALSRQHLEGVWITAVEISGVKKDFSIVGRSLRADLVPRYIALLRNEDALRGMPVGTLSVREREIDPRGEQHAPAGTAGAAPGAPARSGDGGKGAERMVRVVEFRIGTGVESGTGPGASHGLASRVPPAAASDLTSAIPQGANLGLPSTTPSASPSITLGGPQGITLGGPQGITFGGPPANPPASAPATPPAKEGGRR